MMKAAWPSSPPAVAAVAVLAAVVSGSGFLFPAAEATIESTCVAAAARGGRVDARFCALQFTAYRGAAEADLWGLAKTAALISVGLGDDAVYDVREGKVVAPPPAGGARGEAAMRACARAFDAVAMAFAEADGELAAQRYGTARERFGRVAPLARRCDGALAVAGARVPPALAKYGADCQQMAIIGVAITNLIK